MVARDWSRVNKSIQARRQRSRPNWTYGIGNNEITYEPTTRQLIEKGHKGRHKQRPSKKPVSLAPINKGE